MTDTTLIFPGGDVKALGDGRVGGYLVRFGDPNTADVQGDFFTSETYYGKAVKSGTDVIYHHGIGRIDVTANRLGNRVIGDGAIEVKADGLWIEATIAEPEVYAMADAGKLGWSSGSVDRLVRREAVKAGVSKVVQWPIIEASLSPRPVDPRNVAYAIKALLDDEPESVPEPHSETPPPASDAKAEPKPSDPPESGAVDEPATSLASRGAALLGDLRKLAESHDLNAKKREAIKALAEGFRQLYDATAPRPDHDQRAVLYRRWVQSRININA